MTFLPGRGGWRWYAAVLLFLMGIAGFRSGVELSSGLNLAAEGWLAHAYYSLSLFVVSGVDLGTPQSGSWWGVSLLWMAYFGAPVLTASAVIEAVLRVIAPERWKLRRLKDHVVIVGSGDLTTSYLRVLRRLDPVVPVVVVDRRFDAGRERELVEGFRVLALAGDASRDFLLNRMQVRRCRRVVLLGDDDFATFETAVRVLDRYPKLTGRVVLHCHNLRFMRSLSESEVAKKCVTFNAYNFAAVNLVRSHLLTHFERTRTRDAVILGGFGRFGQTVLEELEQHAPGELESIVVIDVEAGRRMDVVQEQNRLRLDQAHQVFEGDISHPEVWRQVRERIDLNLGEPVIILGTGNAAQNLRTALWLKRNWPNCLVFTRTHDASELTRHMAKEQNIQSLSITELLEDNLPEAWIA
ncbi:MAG: potassium transporter TrkA [Gammaproteobacteria bacterium]|nr:potassium transporter TrkA [Gammaproteobacteria bacterium]